jgi:serine phosphatase RsbU (regulator of sigma subunit)
VPLSDSYKLMTLDIPGLAEDITVEYTFAHDRLQQALYDLIPVSAREVIHWRIGQLLLRAADVSEWELVVATLGEPTPAVEDHIFDIVHHLNQGIACCSSQLERDTVAALNLSAGKKASASAAYQPAFDYLTMGVSLLDDNGWQRQYALALALHIHLTRAAYLTGNTSRMQQVAAQVQEQTRTLLDKIDIYDIIIQAYAAQHRFREAIQSTLPVLAEFDITLPADPQPADIGQRTQTITQQLAALPFDYVPTLPAMHDPHTLAAMRMLSSLFSVAYIGAPALMPLVVAEQVILSLRHGHAEPSPFAYANYGLMLCGVLGDIPTGAQFGALALRLLDTLDARRFRAKTLVIVNFFITHWTQHTRDTLTPLLDGYRSGLETGDFEYAGYAAYMHTCHSFLIGRALTDLADEFAANDETLASLQQERTRQQNGLYWQVAINLLEPGEDPWLIEGGHYDEHEALRRLRESNDIPSLANVYFNKLLLCYLFERYDEAVTYASLMEEQLAGVTGSVFVPLFHYYDSLARLALVRAQRSSSAEQNGQPSTTHPFSPSAQPHAPAQTSEAERATFERVHANQEQLWNWAQHAPMNYMHKWYLVAAELAHTMGDDGTAWDYYDQAIELARTYAYMNDEALANELACRFYLLKKRPRIAQVYLRDALYAYQNWGATTRVLQLQNDYAWLLNENGHAAPPSTRTITVTGPQHGPLQLDLTSVLKAYQTISGEIVLDTLLAKLMNTVIENAGAERGLLLLDKAGQWVIEAEGVIGRDDVVVLQSIPLTATIVPQTIINYVAHTRESVVLSNAYWEGPFTQDSYILAHKPHSILCMPLLHQGTLTGMLYLENNQALGAFTADRLEVLNLLSGQVAVSIENANLYAHLEELVDERTAELMQAYRTVKNLNEHLQAELNLARSIQVSLLPPPRPNWHSLDVVCYNRPAHEVGGDLYTYHTLRDWRYMVGVGDVSGKGMPAALLMAVTMALFRANVSERLGPGAFLAHMDIALADYTQTTHQNCAFVYVDIDCTQQASDDQAVTLVRIANAGCVTPIVKRRDGSILWADVGGTPLGVGLGAQVGYQELHLELVKGDMLILTSDGVIETVDPEGNLFGFERFEQAVASGPLSSATAMLTHLRTRVEAFANANEPHDDLTIMVVHI